MRRVRRLLSDRRMTTVCTRMDMQLFAFYLGLVLIFPLGCSPSKPPAPPGMLASAPNVQVNPIQTAVQSSPVLATAPTTRQEPKDLKRLALLWQERKKQSSLSDYPLGPGDVLQISVADLKEISEERVRISGEGKIELPLLGVIQAAGSTESQLKKEIRRLLQIDYMHDPQVSLFAAEHRNRQVAVVGAVANPGLYDLQSESDTILDVVARAGGMSSAAAPRILFMPAELAKEAEIQELISSLPVQLASLETSSALLKKTEPITLDLRTLTKGGTQIYLSLPVRPGDVILVPGTGIFLVDGWVGRPGSYQVFPGMTLVGAIAAAGGTLFAAS